LLLKFENTFLITQHTLNIYNISDLSWKS